jgi:hypothetical protein
VRTNKVRLIGIVIAVSLIAACAPKSVVTPSGKVAYTANEIAKRVGELQTATINAEANHGLPTATTRIIVEASVSIEKVLQTTPLGWQATVVRIWNEAKVKIPDTVLQNPYIATAFGLVEIAMSAIGGGV